MATILTRVRRPGRKEERAARRAAQAAPRSQPEPPEAPELDIAPNDPILAYLQSASGPVDVDKLQMDSPALEQLKAAGLKLVVPLVAQGELIGLLNLGPRLSEQEYSSDDRKLLENLAAQAAPAVRVAQLVREQQAEARRRERVEQELQVARLIQQNFLPKSLPDLESWDVSAYYQPARAVGGDFYDFIELPDGMLGLVVGDVTDKGVPAALVMSATRTLLRASAYRLIWPREVLETVNEVLVPDMPPNMFVTCLYGVLDPATGRFRFANAGHNLPYVGTADGVAEPRATGMPLGLLEGMSYDENEVILAPGETVLLLSDGLIEAHNPDGDMFGFPRLRELVAANDAGGQGLIDTLLKELATFTGEGWEQEDDVTLVALQRALGSGSGTDEGQRVIAEFSVASQPGNERDAMGRVAAAVQGMGIEGQDLERLKTAVAETTMNAMEHGNRYRADLPVAVRVMASDDELVVRITDEGGERAIPVAAEPDLDAKLAGEQSPRGWGLFLVRNMVDDVRVAVHGTRHTVELVIRLKGGES
jgi:serine phosphatase RsbU (regulator of sigma subunit)/anti-sigma regulatory factor (Ser/Thr protein kinase)